MDCKFCEKSFSKGEHLRRHERSHTGSRPYVCKNCKRAFARQDSLMRHERLHSRKQFEELTPSPSSIHSVSTTATPRSLPTMDEETDHASGRMAADILDQIWVGDQQSPSTVQYTPLSAQGEFDLIWPDTEDLFQSIMSSDSANPWQIPLGTLPFVAGLDQMNNSAFGHNSTLYGPGSSLDVPSSQHSAESHRAVQDVSQMVTTLSSSVTAAAKATSITSVFLDECLHMFFERFIPTFPVLHRSTFVFRKCTHPLLLNAIAIGSLYLGPKTSIAKGEAMWRLAHMAVATNWETLITHRGPYDSCNGVQLVLTALLGQVYGALSKNRAIRTTSQAFHAHGFFWARQCGMFDTKPFSMDDLPSGNPSEVEIDHQWRVWAAKEIQHRAVLGNYILDGLISRMSGEVASVRHTANPLGLPSNENLFEARTSREWFSLLRSRPIPNHEPSFRSIFRSLFQLPSNAFLSDHPHSALSFRVILEGLQSLVSDCDSDDLAIVGVPTKTELRRALAEVYASIKRSTHIPLSDRLELLLRWHAICLDACVESSILCRSICFRYKINQYIYGGGTGRTDLDLIRWAGTEEARRTLLHAISIQEIVEQLPRGRAHVIHIPGSLFVAAAVYSVFSMAGLSTVDIPSLIDWKDVLAMDNDPCVILAELSNTSVLSETKRYIYGTGGWTNLGDGISTNLNLFYELNSMQKLFRCLSSQWGIAFDMEEVLDAWITLCH